MSETPRLMEMIWWNACPKENHWWSNQRKSSRIMEGGRGSWITMNHHKPPWITTLKQHQLHWIILNCSEPPWIYGESPWIFAEMVIVSGYWLLPPTRLVTLDACTVVPQKRFSMDLNGLFWEILGRHRFWDFPANDSMAGYCNLHWSSKSVHKAMSQIFVVLARSAESATPCFMMTR